MPEITDGPDYIYRAEWITAGRPLPLEVSRSRYDDDIVSWEVLYWESQDVDGTGCQTPIAEFTTWREAQDWALAEARLSKLTSNYSRKLGPLTQYQWAHRDAWAAYQAGTGPHPYTTDHERLALL